MQAAVRLGLGRLTQGWLGGAGDQTSNPLFLSSCCPIQPIIHPCPSSVCVRTQTVPDQLSGGESREPALQGGGCARCAEGCLLALVQCLPLPRAECAEAAQGMLMNTFKHRHTVRSAAFPRLSLVQSLCHQCLSAMSLVFILCRCLEQGNTLVHLFIYISSISSCFGERHLTFIYKWPHITKRPTGLLMCFLAYPFTCVRLSGGRRRVHVQREHRGAERQHYGQVDSVLHAVPHPVLQGRDGW